MRLSCFFIFNKMRNFAGTITYTPYKSYKPYKLYQTINQKFY